MGIYMYYICIKCLIYICVGWRQASHGFLDASLSFPVALSLSLVGLYLVWESVHAHRF